MSKVESQVLAVEASAAWARSCFEAGGSEVMLAEAVREAGEGGGEMGCEAAPVAPNAAVGVWARRS